MREGDISQVTTLLESADPTELEFVAMSDTSDIDTLLADRVIPHFADLERLALEGAPAETLLARRDEAMVLCAHRHGPRGVAISIRAFRLACVVHPDPHQTVLHLWGCH